MPKYISILGSTGSIGQQALEVISWFPKKFKVRGLAAGGNVDLLAKQIERFNPQVVALKDKEKEEELKKRLKSKRVKIHSGLSGLVEVSTIPEVDLVVVSLVGVVGLIPTLSAIKAGKDIALANKEPLVAAGRLVTDEAKKSKVNILPVDSEHSAIFQCLQGEDYSQIKRIILTCSGGPFLNLKLRELRKVTPQQALSHPTWKMGKKISVDSATLMNKGFEVLEARWLFQVEPDKIEVVIHPQSIIHSLVEFEDGSIKAQLSLPDMRLPISYALFYPQRMGKFVLKPFDLTKLKLTFKVPDLGRFPSLGYAREALEAGGTMPAVLNAANEVAVKLFLEEKIGFMDIAILVKQVMDKHKAIKDPSLKNILKVDKWAREVALQSIVHSP